MHSKREKTTTKPLFDYEYVARMHAGIRGVRDGAAAGAGDRPPVRGRVTRRKLWGIRIVDATEEAEELFIRVQERLAGQPVGGAGGAGAGRLLLQPAEDGAGGGDVRDLHREFPEVGPRRAGPKRRLVYAYLGQFKGPAFDAAGLYEARAALKSAEADGPGDGAEDGGRRLADADRRERCAEAADDGSVVQRARATTSPRRLTVRRLIETYPHVRRGGGRAAVDA
jgi:hypothetical protein